LGLGGDNLAVGDGLDGDGPGGLQSNSRSDSRAPLVWEEMEEIFAQQAEASAPRKIPREDHTNLRIGIAASRSSFPRRAWMFGRAGLFLALVLGVAWIAFKFASDRNHTPARSYLDASLTVLPSEPPKPSIAVDPRVADYSTDGATESPGGPAPVQAGTVPPPTKGAIETQVAETRAPVKPADNDPKSDNSSGEKTAAKSDTPSIDPRCVGSAYEALPTCPPKALLKADRDLAAAYVAALNSNVDTHSLALYSQRWSALRQDAATDPNGTIASYKSMAGELNQLTQDTANKKP
jgi:hypothetical protein